MVHSLLFWQGGFIDDFLSHFMCCCCALVQEWREVEIRGVYGIYSYFNLRYKCGLQFLIPVKVSDITISNMQVLRRQKQAHHHHNTWNLKWRIWRHCSNIVRYIYIGNGQLPLLLCEKHVIWFLLSTILSLMCKVALLKLLDSKHAVS